jgi:hypothetical protein
MPDCIQRRPLKISTNDATFVRRIAQGHVYNLCKLVHFERGYSSISQHSSNSLLVEKTEIYVLQSSSLGERFTSRASAGESCKTFYHPGRSISPLDAHVLKKTAPLIGQSLLSGAWPLNDRWCLVWAVRDGKGNYGDRLTMATKMVIE